jgi:hypothetical protein
VAGGDYGSLGLVAVNGVDRRIRPGEPAFDDGGFSVEVPTRCGRVYRLEYKNRLEETDWAALPLVPGIGGPRRLVDPTASNSSTRFYRVREW